MIHGAYRSTNPNGIQVLTYPNPDTFCTSVYVIALFMMRDPDFISSIPVDLQYLYVDSNPDAPEKLSALQKNIRSRFPVLPVFEFNEYVGVTSYL